MSEVYAPDDGEGPVNFYERDFYPLSNFSAFSIKWAGERFDTSEHLYHWMKFNTYPHGETPADFRALGYARSVRDRIHAAPSAHEAFKIAEAERARRNPNWDARKVDIMRDILRAKIDQHEYVRRKLLATGDRELVEGSWRDDFWGAGPDGQGQNMLGKLWMELRAELRAAVAAKS